jgi:D-threo-aldose 1-dehydrogenase
VEEKSQGMMRSRLFAAPSGAELSFTEVGFGAAPLGNLYGALNEEEAQATLAAAWAQGIRYFDTAPLYGLGLSETRLNHFLRGKKRSDFLISTKVGRRLKVVRPEERTGIGKFFDTPSRLEIYDYSHDGVMRSFEDSLERLGLDNVDILYVHDLDVFNHKSVAARDERLEELMARRRGGHDALRRLRDEKVIQAIGAGINEWESAEILAKRGDFDLFLLAGRYTLLEQEALRSFLPLCVERGIGIVVGGAFNSGILATGAKPGAFYNYAAAPQAILDRVKSIEEVCRMHKVELAQSALHFVLAHPAVVSVILGMSRPEEVAANLRMIQTGVPRSLWGDLKDRQLMRKDAPVPG